VTLDDVKIGDKVKVLMTGSFYTSVVDMNENQICLGSCDYLVGGWFDKNTFFITRDVDIIYHLSGSEREEYIKTKPEILAIKQGDIYYQMNLREKNANS